MIPLQDGAAEDEPMAEINTTPLVDVLLVLLVMLIITIPVQLHAVGIDMPAASTAPPPVEPQVVELDITAAGTLAWNGTTLSGRDELEQRLQDAAAQPQQPEIHIRPQGHAKYALVAAALASAQRLGLQKIGLVGSEQFARE
ncbi:MULTISPECIES: biopolymer transporter ExbD [Ramlibacter]|uniref:Biopolymer transporter ExbD n=1 Tax=Ramlibacter aquaticus TaxID=2780094 RepID=A0ABR9SJN0_9BURK|nr:MULTISPECIES: biopolymer transporter ExbD [Ramlibacter]MBE7942553.1 biopolymer transporter ExbD [Ramlibacter aquaticus]